MLISVAVVAPAVMTPGFSTALLFCVVAGYGAVGKTSYLWQNCL